MRSVVQMLRMPALALGLLILLASSGDAASISWVGQGSWGTAENWSPAQVPVSGDTATIDGQGGPLSVLGAQQAAQVTVQQQSATLDAPLFLSGGVNSASLSDFALVQINSGGVLSGDDLTADNSTFVVNEGIAEFNRDATFTNGSTTQIVAGGTLSADQDISFDGSAGTVDLAVDQGSRITGTQSMTLGEGSQAAIVVAGPTQSDHGLIETGDLTIAAGQTGLQFSLPQSYRPELGVYHDVVSFSSLQQGLWDEGDLSLTWGSDSVSFTEQQQGLYVSETIDGTFFSFRPNPNSTSGDTAYSLVANPEPSTFALCGMGLIGLVWLRRRG